ncbi:MAG: right-handed parallel beta-helix repeat-containing protein [Sphingomonadales bacterium]
MLGIALPVFAQSAGSFRVEETGRSFYRLDDAVKSIGSGSGTIIIAPGRYSDCAVFTGGALTLRAATPSTAIFEGGACEGKATLVFRGASATVDGIVFRGIRVPDRNGSGIRLEKGDLHVVRSTFLDSEQGILTAEDDNAAVSIERSTFSGLGGCPDGMCSHSIYIGQSASLTVSRVRFERGTGGHYVKSRAARVSITDSSFDDSAGRETNYAIDLPNGATGIIAHNVFVVGKNKENHSAIIAVAAEARANSSSGLTVEDNDASIAPGAGFGTTFVADWSHEQLKIGANKLGVDIKITDRR